MNPFCPMHGSKPGDTIAPGVNCNHKSENCPIKEVIPLTQRAKTLLKKIGQTEDSSVRLTLGMKYAAEELKEKGLAIYIPISTGGATVALTAKGIEVFNETENG